MTVKRKLDQGQSPLIQFFYALWRANLISTSLDYSRYRVIGAISMSCLGRTSFPACPSLGAQYLCGFQGLFLQVFFRKFWQIVKTGGKSGQRLNCIYPNTILEVFYKDYYTSNVTKSNLWYTGKLLVSHWQVRGISGTIFLLPRKLCSLDML